jgi:hypothetical protein
LKFKLDSVLIDSNHIHIFSSWIDKKDSSHYNKKSNPYVFKLLHRSSQDGFDPASFHRNCDNKGATIWVAKVQGSTQLVGGYNPLDWDKHSGWKQTADSFVFNFTNGKNISTAELSYSSNRQHSVYCSKSYGPHTSSLQSSFDNKWSYYESSINYHPKIGIPANFTVENYEIFQVITK